MTQSTVYITIGMIGSGKSTFAKKQAMLSPTLIVAKDALREMLFGDYKFDEVIEPLISKINDKTIQSCLSEFILGIAPYQNLIIDEYNLTKKDRITYVNMIRDIEEEYHCPEFFKIVYVYFQDIDGHGIARRTLENRGLSEDYWWNVLQWQMRRIEVPTVEEAHEHNIEIIMVK
jgi:predicted kinase